MAASSTTVVPTMQRNNQTETESERGSEKERQRVTERKRQKETGRKDKQRTDIVIKPIDKS